MKFFATLVLCAVAALGADPTGRWTATPPAGKKANTKAKEIVFSLKAEGDKLTGTVATGRKPQTIVDGKITGDQISFFLPAAKGKKGQQATTDEKAARTEFRGTLSGDEIKFTRMKEGARRGQEFVAKKAS